MISGVIFSSMSTFGERLKEARIDAKLSQAKLGEKVGLKQPTIADLESYGKGSSKTTLFAKALNVSALWLSDGIGNKHDKFIVNKLEIIERDDTHSIDLPLLAATGSMGDGANNHDADIVVDMLRVTKSWLDKTFNSVSKLSNLRFIHAIGDSMNPTFNDGDILLVDTGIQNVSVDGVYVLETHERLFIKRVRQKLNGEYEISSDNHSVKTVDILNGDHQVEVKGRVIWVWNGRRV